MQHIDAYRLIYAESDGVPGLIVDRYGDWLATQFLTAGVEARRELLLQALARAFRATRDHRPLGRCRPAAGGAGAAQRTGLGRAAAG